MAKLKQAANELIAVRQITYKRETQRSKTERQTFPSRLLQQIAARKKVF